MKPQARPFTVEIKRSRQPAGSKTILSLAPLRPDAPERPERPGPSTRPDDRGGDAAPLAALSEAERVFKRPIAPVRVAEPALGGIDARSNADRHDSALSQAGAVSASLDGEVKVGARPRSGCVLPDLLSAARNEEQALNEQAHTTAPRSRETRERLAQPETAEPKAAGREERARSHRRKATRVDVRRLRENVLPPPEVAIVEAEQPAMAMMGVEEALSSPKPSGVGRANSGGRFRRKAERTGRTISLKAGERWKHRLPPACR